MTKRKATKNIFEVLLILIISVVTVALIGLGININLKSTEEGYIVELELSEEQLPAVVEDDMGEIIEIEEVDGQLIPTVEEVDGGRFEDEETGVSIFEGDYEDLGWAEWYPTDTPEAFKNATLGHCVRAGNRFGSQCVSLFRAFTWSYADRDISTCGTGMAKGMMNCAEENAGDEYLIYWAESKDIIQAGDWLIFDGGQYGHVGMALGPVVNGYVALLGENQGGQACEGGGAATNIINISIKNLIGFYRPKAYVKPEPAPEPEPEAESYTVVKGDTLGAIIRKLGWYTGTKLFGDDGYAQEIAEFNGIANRGLIYPGQVILRK